MKRDYWISGGAAFAGLIALCFALGWLLAHPKTVLACEPEPITPYTPTGIAGCERWGDGIASHYGPGSGVAMNFCTWEVRHSTGCGWVFITSNDTGLGVQVPVVDFCDCYTGTPDERIVDLQYGVVAALGLDLSRGLYPVTVSPAQGVPAIAQPSEDPRLGGVLVSVGPPAALPNTAMEVQP